MQADSALIGHSLTLVYIDDIIVVGKSFEEHPCNLQTVFECLRKAGLKLQLCECQQLQHKVIYLGHVVSAQGIAPDTEKTRRVDQWPVLGHYFEKVIYYLVLVTATAMKSVTVIYHLI